MVQAPFAVEQLARLAGFSRFYQRQKLFGGAYRDRTDDPLLAKQVLSQLS